MRNNKSSFILFFVFYIITNYANAQLLEFQNRLKYSSVTATNPLAKVKSAKPFLDKSLKYELKRMKQDSALFSSKIELIDSLNEVHLNQYAPHNQKIKDFSASTYFKSDSLSSLLILNHFKVKRSLEKLEQSWKGILPNFALFAKSKNVNDSSYYKTQIYNSFHTIDSLIFLAENDLKVSIEYVNEIEKLKNIETENSRLVAFLPEINTFFNKVGYFAPSINLLGTQDIKTNAFSGNIKLFSTSLPASDKIDFRSLAVAQTSEFGIVADFIGGFKKSKSEPNKPKSLGIRFGSSYLLKRGLNEQGQRDSTYSFGLFHSHLGLEYVIVPKILAIYGDYNQQMIGTNLTTIEKKNKNLFDIKHQLGFYNTGVKFLINPTGALSQNLKKFPIVIDLNFIWVSKKYAKIDEILKKGRITGDKVIPNIKLSLIM